MISIKHRVEKSSEGLYYSIPFEVPEGCERLEISYSYRKAPLSRKKDDSILNIIDLGIANENGEVLGWSGSSRKSVHVGEYDSTKGYLQEKINPGVWSILVGAYKVESGGVEVEYTIDFIKKNRRALVGDLHMHSDASDGKESIYELCRDAQRLGLDFISVTNHNNYAENLCLPQLPGLTLIPGTEWTHYKGHMNFLGVPAPFGSSFVANSLEDMRKTIATAREKGASIVVNHPKCGLCPYLWEDETCFDMVEVWNGPMTARNLRAIKWWTELLKKGRKIPIVGGSDFHRKHDFARMGSPVTVLYCDSPSAKDILSAAALGRGYVARNTKAPKPDMSCGGAGLGETASGSKICIIVKELNLLQSVYLVSDKGRQKVKGRRKNGVLTADIPVDGAKFAYLLICRPSLVYGSSPVAITNPIYFE